MAMPNTVNLFHQDKWQISFSNIPTVSDLADIPLYDLYVKSVVLPDINLTETFSNFQNEVVRQPVTRSNEDLSQLQVTFKADENLKNYYNMFTWIMSVRFGDNITTEKVRDENIKKIQIILLDNEKRKKGILGFKDCFLLSLSSLSLNMGTAEEIEFTCNFSYKVVNFDLDVSSV